MGEVRAEESHGNEIKKNDIPSRKSEDDHLPWAGFRSDFELRIDAHGEVQKVKNDEGENGQAAPNHDARRLGGLHSVIKFVFPPRFFTVASERDRENDMQNEANQEENAREPDSEAVESTMQKCRVFIKGVLADENEQVSR